MMAFFQPPHNEWDHLGPPPPPPPADDALTRRTADLLALDAGLTTNAWLPPPPMQFKPPPPPTRAFDGSFVTLPQIPTLVNPQPVAICAPSKPISPAVIQKPPALIFNAEASSSQAKPPSPSSPKVTKRPRPDPIETQSSSSTATASSSSSAKRAKATRASSPKSPVSALLTPGQKKANHIQSEQKRRANIRKGYDALCATIPALREAIKREDEEAAASAGSQTSKKRKGKGPATMDDHMDSSRAGPRSECVVLNKSALSPLHPPTSYQSLVAVEHIQSLLSERDALLTRLEAARSRLGHDRRVIDSQQSSQTVQPLWERKWEGGTGLMSIDAEEEEEELEADA